MVPFCLFFCGLLIFSLNSRKKGTLISNGLLGSLAELHNRILNPRPKASERLKPGKPGLFSPDVDAYMVTTIGGFRVLSRKTTRTNTDDLNPV